MTVPTTEASIYANSLRDGQARIIMGLDYPCWTAQFHDDFSDALDPINYRFSMQALNAGGEGPLVEDGKLKIRSFRSDLGGPPPFEWVCTRSHVLPRDPDLAFQIIINATFPVDDPRYDTGFIIGTLNGEFGPGSDIKVIQHGFATSPNYITPAPIIIYPPDVYSSAADEGVDPLVNASNAAHEYKIEWRPNGTPKLKIFLDSVEVYSGDGERPYYVAFGIEWTTVAVRDGSPVQVLDGTNTLLEINDFVVDELDSEGFESRTYPDWTTANAGGTTFDNTAEGERVTVDSQTWAIVPTKLISSWQVSKGINQNAATFALNLAVDILNLDSIQWPHYEGRDLLIDTKIDSASWKRQISAKIELPASSVSEDGVPSLTLSGRCRVMTKMDDAVQFTAVASDTVKVGVYTSITFQFLFEESVALANVLAGDVLGDIDTDINAPNIGVESLTDAGQNLLTNVVEWADRLVQELWVKYATSGSSKYGTLVVNVWDTTPKTAYAFTTANGSAARLTNDARRPGRIAYNPNTARAGLLTETTIPSQGAAGYTAYPVFPYPSYRSRFSDSIAYANIYAIENTTSFPKQGGVGALFGGIAQRRWHREISSKRRCEITTRFHDWVEPGDCFTFEGDNLIDVHDDEVWKVEDIEIRGDSSGITFTITGGTTDIIGALTRGGY